MGHQPFYVKKYERLALKNADMVNKYGMYIPNHQDLQKHQIEKIINLIRST